MDQFLRALYEQRWAMTAIVSSIALGACLLDMARGKPRRFREALCNVSIFVIGQGINWAFLTGAQIWLLTRFSPLMTPWPRNGFTFLFCVLAIDFIFYWRHRFEHKLPILWAEHSVHHDGHELNFSTALRLPWLNPFNGPLAIPLVLLGLPVDYIIGAMAMNLLFQYLVHNEVVGRLGVLERIFVTPSNHRVHHGQNPQYIDKNFGGIFIFWDFLFGTYALETEKPRYSGERSATTVNPIAVNMRPVVRYFRTLL